LTQVDSLSFQHQPHQGDKMQGGLDDRVALITGGSKGIGLAIAKALYAQGASVALLARHKDELEAAAAEVGNSGRVLTLNADLTNADEVSRAVEQAAAWKGKLNVIVNNAGPPMRPGALADHSDDVWRDAFDTKALGAIRVSRSAMPKLATDGTGRIVNISGVTAETVMPNGIVTAVINAGVQALTSYLATEAAEQHVTVNAVCPGMTDTEGWRQRLTAMAEPQGKTASDLRDGMTKGLGIRAGRWAQPDEIGGLVAFLASDAGAYITGQVMRIDGGLVKAV
jgi:NAD(P)-dependent dehydrogenase (short-subunit alcohol dehydrogenase family)